MKTQKKTDGNKTLLVDNIMEELIRLFSPYT